MFNAVLMRTTCGRTLIAFGSVDSKYRIAYSIPSNMVISEPMILETECQCQCQCQYLDGSCEPVEISVQIPVCVPVESTTLRVPPKWKLKSFKFAGVNLLNTVKPVTPFYDRF